MDKVVDQFIGLDPIVGDQAMDELIRYGEKSLDLVIERFGSLDRVESLRIRLGELFGHFGERALDRLMEVLQTGMWHRMVDATYCFSHLDRSDAASRLVQLITGSEDIDIRRCAIDALGVLRAKDRAYVLLDLFPMDMTGFAPSNRGYHWDKLSYFVFIALFRMATKEEDEGSINHYYQLPDIERFYAVAGKTKFGNLANENAYTLAYIFGHFKPVATDAIVQKWLKGEIRELQKIALAILAQMRLSRIEGVLQRFLEAHKGDEEMERDVAFALSDIPSRSAAKTVAAIWSGMNEGSAAYVSVSLALANCLHKLDDKEFIERVYPQLLQMGGEVCAHTCYNLGVLGYKEDVWAPAIHSEDYLIRAAGALVYANVKGSGATPRLLQIERESTHDIEKLLVLCALIKAGHPKMKDELRKRLSLIQKGGIYLRTFRYIWRREIIIALGAVEDEKAMKVWENLIGLNVADVTEEMSIIGLQKKADQPEHKSDSTIGNEEPGGAGGPVTIFISYAHGDLKWKDKLKRHLSALRDQELLVSWDDRQISSGTWDDKIETAMRQADIFLLLVTDRFIASEYITSKEITTAYARFKVGTAKIFPVICDSCDWELKPVTKMEKEWHPVLNQEMYVWLGKFQHFPRNGKPIKNWRNQQDAFVEVIGELRKEILAMRRK